MSRRLFEKIYSLIEVWEPEKIWDIEADFRDDLLDFLKDELKQSEKDLGTSENISIKKEDGRGLCDIGVNRQIGIELKLNLDKKSKANRLIGQIMEYSDDYPTGIIVLLLGDTEHNAYQTVKDGIRKIQSVDQEFRILQKNLNKSENEKNDTNSGNIFSENPFEKINDDFEKINEKMNEFAKRFSLR